MLLLRFVIGLTRFPSTEAVVKDLNKFVSLYIAPDTGRALYVTFLTHLLYIDQICVEVFRKTIRRTEMIEHSFERKLNGAWNRLC